MSTGGPGDLTTCGRSARCSGSFTPCRGRQPSTSPDRSNGPSITTATEFVTAAFWTAPQYKDFVDSYGFDITDWSGFGVMRRARELTMTTWLMQNVNESPEIRAEFEKRLGTLKAGKPTVPWQAF
jgi:hypothetical protein